MKGGAGRGREDEAATEDETAGRGREDETATKIAGDTTTAIGRTTSDGGTMGTRTEETMMGAEGIDGPMTHDLWGAVGVGDRVTPRTRTTTDQAGKGGADLDYY